MKVIVASNNKGKIAELKEILGSVFELVSLSEAGIDVDVEETGTSLEQNSLIKAKAIFDLTGVPALADDSGLFVDALGGAPGVYSARYAGGHDDQKNIDLLLKNMEGAKNRAAHFACCLTLYLSKDNVISAIGKTNGYILTQRTGDGGFGYDPVFFSSQLNKPFGLCTPEEKNRISHRKKSAENLLKKFNP